MIDDFLGLHKQVHKNLEAATSKYKSKADVHHRELQFNVGDRSPKGEVLETRMNGSGLIQFDKGKFGQD